MVNGSAARYVGAVIEFKLPRYFVYGVVIEENQSSGDTILMLAPKYRDAISDIPELYSAPHRCNIRFFSKFAAARKNSDILGIRGKVDLGLLPVVDLRFRLCLAGLSDDARWQIVEGRERVVVPHLTVETALLSDDGIPNAEAIRDYYDSDYYPWSAALTARGKINFDARAFEEKMRRKIAESGLGAQ
jgi:hypothetical protein